MLALLCASGAEGILEQCDGILDVRLVTAMSELRRYVATGYVEGIVVDARLGVTEAVRQRVPQVPIYEFTPPFDLAAVMRWEEQLRMRRNSSSETSAPSQTTTENSTSSTSEPIASNPTPSLPTSSPEVLTKVTTENVSQTERSTLSSASGTSPPHHPIEELRRTSRPAVRRRVIPVLMLDSPKGGAGRSTLGAHTAYYAALKGKRVAVIDLDVNGDIAQKFGFTDAQDVRGWRGGSVEEAVRDGVCLLHESGLHLFPSPQSPEVVLQSPEDAEYLVNLCLEEMDVVLLDMPQGWTPIHQAVLPYTTKVMLVVNPAVDQLARIQEHADKLAFSGLDASGGVGLRQQVQACACG
ncbi:AAA family ATPase [Alicyclobacillus acidocaldarius]|uniref:Flp pilus assembly protein ATPase CpaE-like protein n=1 Tax=Alicyclobacillus acidocaldarius (strain Tc-4-1) TaxID=1048834 RepID=F8IL86_ALIAT|nr:P-loop NTPase [Alicyclobacillus acidocaldarius]AEJ43652.1 Flp pilus assembly protein ATPase CpaE-like protein [Alicyclobacillus acidocaldarius subsp. acidocaldarius Tc-4-1]